MEQEEQPTEMGTRGEASFDSKAVFLTSSDVSSRSTALAGFSSSTCSAKAWLLSE